MVEVVRKNKVKVQLAHQMRTSPFTLRAKAMVDAGEIGAIQEVRTRGKEDRRAGGEDMMVLGSHLCDMVRYFLGNPVWVTAHVTNNGSEIGGKDVRQPTEPIGPVAGNQITAMFAFADGVHAFFASRAVKDTDPLRFGTWLYGSKGVIFLPNAIYPGGGLYVLRSAAWLPDAKHQWEQIEAKPDLAGQGISTHGDHEVANALMVADLLRAIEGGGKPCCNEEDGRWTIEMVHSIYQAQKAGDRVKFPLVSRAHPLASP
jgi:predicted dehydrogenase